MILAGPVIGILAGLFIERAAARPGAVHSGWPSVALRAVLLGILCAFWLGLFRRPLLAGAATVATVAIVTAISVRKRQLVGEPLVFSDFALVGTIARHPDLYYLGFIRDPRFVAGCLALVGVAVTWMWLEPPWLEVSIGLALVTTVAIAAGIAWWAAAVRPVAGRLAAALPRPDLEEHVSRWGLTLTLAAYALRWRGEVATEATGPGGPPTVQRQADPPQRVIVVQLESFVDPARLGLAGEPPPGLGRARRLALWHGPLRVPTHGAFTMRTEHEVLTGRAARDSFAGFDPYLSRRGQPSSLASELKARGYRTLFLHPFRRTFFRREKVMPALGFDEFLWEADFSGAERHGPYVSDEALIARLLEEIGREPDRPAFAMAVSMENHGPWFPGRLPDERSPLQMYLRHVASADRAIARLLDGLARLPGRTLLCVYGDHPPILPELAPSCEPESDYLVAEFSREDGQESRPTPPTRLAAHELGVLVRRLAAG